MFGSEILEVAIGLVFVFLVTSLMASTIRETIEAGLRTRAIQLERGIRLLLDDPDGTGLTKDIFDHPLLFGLFTGAYDPSKLTPVKLSFGGGAGAPAGPGDQSAMRAPVGSNLPAYIPSRNFALALMHVVGGQDGGGVLSLDGLTATVLTLPPGKVREALVAAISEAGQDLGRVRISLEAWFDSNMDRVSGWYKRETQWILIVLGLILAVTLNINSLGVTQELWSNNNLRQDIVVQAAKTVSDLQAAKAKAASDAQTAQTANASPANADLQTLSEDSLRKQFNGLSGLVGWSMFDQEVMRLHPAECGGDAAKCRFTELWWQHAASSLPGWLLTALAVSLGAPFWFDLLNKFMIIRSTVKPTQKSPSERSEDAGGSPSSAEILDQSSGSTGSLRLASAAMAPARATGQPQTVVLRLAIGLANVDPATLALKVDGGPVAVAPDGFVEIPLQVEVPHQLAVDAVATDGTKLAWSRTIAPHMNDDGLPISIDLSPVPAQAAAGPAGPASDGAAS